MSMRRAAMNNEEMRIGAERRRCAMTLPVMELADIGRSELRSTVRRRMGHRTIGAEQSAAAERKGPNRE